MRLRKNLGAIFLGELHRQTPFGSGRNPVYDPCKKSIILQSSAGRAVRALPCPDLGGIWRCASSLHNTPSQLHRRPSVEGRMRAFDDASRQMFLPEKTRGLAIIARHRRASVRSLFPAFPSRSRWSVAGRIVRPFVAAPWLVSGLILGHRPLAARRRRRRKKAVRPHRVDLAVCFLNHFGGGFLLPRYFFMAVKMVRSQFGAISDGRPVNLLASISKGPPSSRLPFCDLGMNKPAADAARDLSDKKRRASSSGSITPPY